MNAPDMLLERYLHAAQVGRAMKDAGLPSPFITQILDLARENRGIYELMALWEEADNPKDRDEAVADLQELLEDEEERPSTTVKKPYIRFDQLDEVGQGVLAQKAKLRDLIDRHGGVSRVAELSGIPQPSLSRMLSSASMPRRTTLYKIALALGIPETDVASVFVW